MFASLNSGDEVIIPTPYWVSYPDMTILAGGTPKFLNCNEENDFKIKGLKINNILTVNGIRFSLEDGSWGLIRASSNKPSLVVVTESPTSDELKKEIFYFIDKLLQETGKIGEYDQKIN